MYPSESVLQSWMTIVRTEGGVAALFRGNLAAVYLWVGYAAVQFSIYTDARDFLDAKWGHGVHPTATAFVAGAAAGVCATLATYPFDVCRTTFAARGVLTVGENGSNGGRGTAMPKPEPPPLPKHQVPFHSLAEPHFSQREQMFRPIVPAEKPKAVSGGGSSPSSVPRTFWEFGAAMYRQRGWRGFYAGAGPAVLQIVPYMGMNFAIYDALTRNDRSATLSGYAGSISGAISKVVVYPVDTIKRRLQAQAFFSEGNSLSGAAEQSAAYRGTVDCARRILLEEGVASFYRGVVPSVLKSMIGSGLSFGLFRLTKNALESSTH